MPSVVSLRYQSGAYVFTFLLLFKEFFLGYITAVTLGKNILAHGLDGFSCNDLSSYGRLDGNLEQLSRISSFSFSHILRPRS